MKIINFGSLNIDKVCSVEEFVQPGETIMATGYSVNAGGKGLNQSVAAARAGAQVLHAGAVGSDGLFLKEILADAGADVSCLRVMDTESGCAFIEVNSKGQNRIIVSAGTNRMYTEEYIKNVLEKAEAGDFVLLQNEINMVGEIIRLSHEKGCRVVFNASPIPGKPEELPLELVDIFMVNELEAAALAGTSTEGDFRDILKALQKKYPKAAIVMTLGKEGVFYGYKEEFYSHPIFKVNAVDTTAAGDTFCGYFLAALCAEKSVETALREASAASAMAVSAKGAAPSMPGHSAGEEWLCGRSYQQFLLTNQCHNAIIPHRDSIWTQNYTLAEITGILYYKR